jgi:preprotein translocase subunit SecA
MKPTADHRRTALIMPRKIHRGLDATVHALIGRSARGRAEVKLHEQAAQIHELAGQLGEASEESLRERLADARQSFRRGEELTPTTVQHALAAVAVVARRQLGLTPYVVQLMGALAVQRGYLLEMATGEGKTLTIALAAVLAGWTGQPCHILTANDYLASRDAAWLEPFYRRCGLTAGCVLGEMPAPERTANYQRDLTYTTSKEVVADFLRDRLQLGPLVHSTRRLLRAMLQPGAADEHQLVLRGLHTAIVDEADSALIDEAVTPLIISREQENEPLRQACEIAHRLASGLTPGVDYQAETQRQEIVILPAGLANLARHAVELPGMWGGAQRRAELVKQALRAREFFHRGKQYVVEDGKIVIVDEFTGRLMHQRTWQEGLHQAVEAKEGLAVTTPAATLARLSFQRFFRFYRKLSGLSGTVWDAAPEVWQMYRLPVVRVPTNRPCLRVEPSDRVFASTAEKWTAIVEEIVARHATGQPLLIGTRSIAMSERLAAILEARGLSFALLNALRHREEAAIVAEAGGRGRITIATNMAGRGTDIVLGPGVKELGGLHVVLTERHESRRIDRQLMGRAARQGDPGSAQAFVSLEDELPCRHTADWLRERVRGALAAQLPAAGRVAKKLIDFAQQRAERAAYRQRRAVLEMDSWVEQSLGFAGPSAEA